MYRTLVQRICLLSTGLLLACGIQFMAAATASAHTCGSNWCSGSDGDTPDNIQGNNDQIYLGEVGYYYQDLPGGGGSGAAQCPSGPGGFCFNPTAAKGADSHWKAGTGLGVQFYHFGGGADSSLEGQYGSPYCFGWHQATDARNQIAAHFKSYEQESYYIFIDIEQNSTFGWSDTTQSGNQKVFDGFSDNIAGRSPAENCNGSTTGGYQYAIYSSPDQWTYSFDSQTDSQTPLWTYEKCCYDNYPQSYDNAEWFAGSSYHAAWQFHGSTQGTDWEVAYEPEYLPLFGIYIGS